MGVGGVGSWAAEALARSGLGYMVLVDMDHVSESNMNRQVQACKSSLGKAKVQALCERLADAAPHCEVTCVDAHLDSKNADSILRQANWWIDACDDMRAKLEMILWANKQSRLRQLVVSGAAGGKLDATRIEITDLSQTRNDPLLSKLRYSLRRSHGFAREGRLGISAVFSSEPMRVRDDCAAAARLNCAGYGSLVSVTAGMGMAAAGWVLSGLARSAPASVTIAV